MKRFPSSRCASAIQIVRPSQSNAETQPQLHPALGIVDHLRLRFARFKLGAYNVSVKIPNTLTAFLFSTLLGTTSSFAQETSTATSAGNPTGATSPIAAPGESPDAIEMMKRWTEMAKLGENHKLLADFVGTWDYTMKFWVTPDPNTKPQESKGTAITKPIMGGRYFVTEVNGKMQMPGPDGKMKDTQFEGVGIDAYDNATKKFVVAWIDNMITGIMLSEGIYDSATKTFTYNGEYQSSSGIKRRVREVTKIADKDHHIFEWYENRGGDEVKTMEISYTRRK
jgi:Protein of unknown function (DUF1579)